MEKKISLIVDDILTILLIVVLLATSYIVVAKQDALLKVYVVVSESMTPSLKVGDIIFTWYVHPESIHVNDIITYKNSGVTITHRVYAKKNDGFITKGDANNVTDGLIKYEQVTGKVIIVLPKIGYIFHYFTVKQIVIFIVGLICMYVFILYKRVSM